ncbi:MAG: YitT family protein [Clostridiaceae bacterium]|nr:YitT family protein [Clostridiaceae bacterium]
MKNLKRPMTYLVIVCLALLCALNYQIFVFPNRFAPAGLNGICTMIQHISGISVGYLSLLINLPLALVAWRRVGTSLASRSMTYVVAFSLALIALGRMDLSAFAYETANGTSKILGPLVAGIINGACYSLLVRCSSSSGGTDFVAALIHRAHPEQGFFWITFLLNVAVAVSSYFVYDFRVEPVILCILYSFMSSTVSDRLMKSGRSAIRCEIVTDHPREISDAIIRRLRHSATLIPAKGMYQGRETHILVCVVNKVQMPALEDIVREYPHTFAVLSDAREVVGNFKRLDSKGMPERELLDKGENQMA